MCFPVIKNMGEDAWEIFLDQVWKWWTAVIFIHIPLDETHSYGCPNKTEAETYVQEEEETNTYLLTSQLCVPITTPKVPS